MNTAAEARLDAQARQMAFEMGFAPDPRAAAQQAHPAGKGRTTNHGAKLSLVRPATEKQIAFIKGLVAERVVVPGTTLQGLLDLSRHMAVSGAFTTVAASKLIEALQEAPRKVDVERKGSSRPEPEDGIWFVPGDDEGSRIFKVYTMVHGSGRQGLKKLVVDEHGSGRFEYVGLAARHLPAAARKMTLEEAAAFGRLYGVCVRCGRTLTDEASIAAGIGPICAEKM